MNFYRPTTMGLALAQAALKKDQNVKPNESNWVQRRIALNLDRNGLGVIKEQEQVHLKYKTAQKLKSEGII